ncbi:hypothetical protein ACFLS9_07315 [Bacteroidota bacterium]
MKKHVFIVFIILLIPSLISFSGNKIKKSVFISGNLSFYQSNSNNTNNIQSNLPRIGFGLGVGFPLNNNIFFFGKINYLIKSDFDAYYDNSTFRDDIQVINNIVYTNASISQLIVNGGLQYKIYLADEFTLGLIGGFTYSLVDQNAKDNFGETVSKISNEGFYGYFGGASLEKNIENENFSIFIEAIYNYIKSDVVYYRNVFSGLDLTIGGRYYFSG